ncbi:MAG: hypothetical protein AAF721_15035 [Myxococcota bacterium]
MVFRRAWVMVGFAWIGGLACDTPPPVAPAPPEPTAPAEQAKAEEPEPPPDPTTTPPARPTLGVQLHAVRRLAHSVEIEVVLDRALPPMGSIRPSLDIGGEVTRKSRAGRDGRLDHLIFTVEPAQFERMRSDAEIIVRAGPLSNEVAETKPRLSEVVATGEGGAR